MFNEKRSTVLERGTCEDEFVVKAPNYTNYGRETTECRLTDTPESISSNFDKIMHWEDFKNTGSEVQNNKVEYNNYVNGVSNSANPSTTTMQFTNMTRAEQFQDYKQEEKVESVKRPNKTLVFVLVAVGLVVGLMTIFNGLLLAKMDNIIKEKTETIDSLVEQTQQIDSEIEYAKSADNIYQKLVEKGLV